MELQLASTCSLEDKHLLLSKFFKMLIFYEIDESNLAALLGAPRRRGDGTCELSPVSLVPWSRVCTCMNTRVGALTSKQPDVDISLLSINTRRQTNVPSTHKINQTLHTFAVLDFQLQIIYKWDQ